MRGPRTANELRLYKECDTDLYHRTIDEDSQQAKWKEERVDRARPRRESTLDEFLRAFDMVPQPVIEFARDEATSKVLSPVLDGHEAARQRRAKLLLELEEAVPEGPPSPKKFSLPPAWSEA